MVVYNGHARNLQRTGLIPISEGNFNRTTKSNRMRLFLSSSPIKSKSTNCWCWWCFPHRRRWSWWLKRRNKWVILKPILLVPDVDRSLYHNNHVCANFAIVRCEVIRIYKYSSIKWDGQKKLLLFRRWWWAFFYFWVKLIYFGFVRFNYSLPVVLRAPALRNCEASGRIARLYP